MRAAPEFDVMLETERMRAEMRRRARVVARSQKKATKEIGYRQNGLNGPRAVARRLQQMVG